MAARKSEMPPPAWWGLEIRQNAGSEPGRTVCGTLMKYGEQIVFNGVRERFLPGAFGTKAEIAELDVVCNFQHQRARPLCRTRGGGLVLADTVLGLAVEATMPKTSDGDDVLTLIRSNTLKGYSCEFRGIDVENQPGGRVIRRASLEGLAICDSPAYSSATIDCVRAIAKPRRRTWL